MRAAPVSFVHPPPQLWVFNQIIHKLYKYMQRQAGEKKV